MRHNVECWGNRWVREDLGTFSVYLEGLKKNMKMFSRDGRHPEHNSIPDLPSKSK
jgi:hypothetical protein